MDIEIYQIFFKDIQRRHLAQAFKPLENLVFDGYYEFGVFHRAFTSGLIKPGKLTGIVSWKFELKSYVPADEWLALIRSQPGADVYILNPFPELPRLHKNVWEQGGQFHPGFLDLAQQLFHDLKYDIQLKDLTHLEEHWSFCNYWVGTFEFWTKYMAFALPFYEQINNPASRFYHEFRKSAQYHGGGSYMPFFFERLLSTYLALHPQTKVAAFPWTEDRMVRMVSSMRDDVNQAHAELDIRPPRGWVGRKVVRVARLLTGNKAIR